LVVLLAACGTVRKESANQAEKEAQETEKTVAMRPAVQTRPAAGADGGKAPMRAISPLSLGEEAPDFEAETVGGEHVTPSDLKGKVVLLEFWAT
jgi:cytochrome oxidase Cu insertion factor (SCO1/SenC/PrrC family)